jgi:hypothetical protein
MVSPYFLNSFMEALEKSRKREQTGGRQADPYAEQGRARKAQKDTDAENENRAYTNLKTGGKAGLLPESALPQTQPGNSGLGAQRPTPGLLGLLSGLQPPQTGGMGAPPKGGAAAGGQGGKGGAGGAGLVPDGRGGMVPITNSRVMPGGGLRPFSPATDMPQQAKPSAPAAPGASNGLLPPGALSPSQMGSAQQLQRPGGAPMAQGALGGQPQGAPPLGVGAGVRPAAAEAGPQAASLPGPWNKFGPNAPPPAPDVAPGLSGPPAYKEPDVAAIQKQGQELLKQGFSPAAVQAATQRATDDAKKDAQEQHKIGLEDWRANFQYWKEQQGLGEKADRAAERAASATYNVEMQKLDLEGKRIDVEAKRQTLIAAPTKSAKMHYDSALAALKEDSKEVDEGGQRIATLWKNVEDAKLRDELIAEQRTRMTGAQGRLEQDQRDLAGARKAYRGEDNEDSAAAAAAAAPSPAAPPPPSPAAPAAEPGLLERAEQWLGMGGKPSAAAAPAASAPGSGADPYAFARQAIQQGAPRDAVLKRLQQMGLDPGKL